MSTNTPTQRVGVFSFTRALTAATWTGCSFALAQLAEGDAVNLLATVVFSILIGSVAGRLRTHIGYGMFLMSSVALSAVLVSSLGYGTSLDQFFPSVFGPIDYLLVLLLWLSPVVSMFVARCELKFTRWMRLTLEKLLKPAPQIVLPGKSSHGCSHWFETFIDNSVSYSRQHPRRGPPSFVVS